MAVSPLAAGTGLVTDAGGRARFVIERPVAKTAFGITYLARHTSLNATVALKEFAPPAMCSRQPGGQVVVHQDMKPDFARMKARFVREGQTMHGIQHPNVVQALDCWRESDTAYLATRWVEQGEPLDFRLASQVSLPQRHQLLLQLLDALHAAHATGILHNDVKPANVLVAGRLSLVLIDFGVARQEAELRADTRSAMFTWGWAAPEIMDPASLQHAGPWSDLYAWGLMALETFIGLGASGPVAPPQRLLGVDPYASAETRLLQAGVGAVWAQSIAACVSVAIGRRPSSAADLLRTLHSALPIGVTPIPRWSGGTAVPSGLPANVGNVVRVCDGCGTACPPTGHFCAGCGLELKSAPVISDVVGRAATGRRVIASLLDGVLVVVLAVTLLAMLLPPDAGARLSDDQQLAVFLWIFVPLDVLYHTVTGWIFRGSIGKLIVGLRVRSADHEEPSAWSYFWRAVVRTLGVSLLGYGAVWIWTNPRRRAIHDYAAGTCLVRIQKSGGQP